MPTGILLGLLGRWSCHPKRGLPAEFRSALVIAHRGVHAEHPENSMGAFLAAQREGIPFELDVQLSKDGQPVVCHDDDLMRCAGVGAKVADLPASELRSICLRRSGRKTSEGIPTLAEALDATTVPMMIEIKQRGTSPTGIEEAIVRLLTAREGAAARSLVASFNPLVLRRMKRLLPEVRRCQLFETYRGDRDLSGVAKVFLRRLWLNRWSEPDAVAGELCMLTRRRAKGLDRRGYDVLAWTIRCEADARRALVNGVRHLLCDIPASVVEQMHGIQA